MTTYVLVYSIGMGFIFGIFAWIHATNDRMGRWDKATVIGIAVVAGMALGAFGAFLRASEIRMFGGFR